MRDLPAECQPVIIAARRSPITRRGGALSALPLEELAAPVIRAALSDAGLPGDAISDVILGNAVGGGGNIARLAALQAGLPLAVPGVTVDRQCGSGLEAVVLACRLIAAGAGDAYLAGGVESTSQAPIRARPGPPPEPYARARFAPDAIGDPDMIEAADTVAARFGISRARQDAFALSSHRRALAAAKAGRFAAEIVPMAGVQVDDGPRPTTSLQALAALPARRPGGTVTAGNACPLNDGAAVLAITSRARARALGHTRALAFVDAAAAGVDPNILGISPVAAMAALRARRPDLTPDAARFIEFNEAFAAQVLASLDQIGVEADRVNRDGGAIALGHPFGTSGAVLVVRLMAQARADGRPGDLGLAMMGIAGGIGLAAAFRVIAP
ncbi:thiolase family protein [Paracoccus sp. p3-h83]|uniref:thiolase family protein n=1 Tax=Paracoccus sp. p3-h83 TaxID=3342805 RepID=UPI0035BB963F